MVAGAVSCAAWLELTGDLLQRPPSTHGFPHAEVADLMLSTFGAAVCSWHSVDPTWTDHVLALWPRDHLPVPSPDEVVDSTRHPLLRWYEQTREAAPSTSSRVPASVADHAMTARWLDFARPTGIAHQLAIPLWPSGAVREAYLLSRPDGDYTDDDVALAALVRPVLRALHRQHAALDAVAGGAVAAAGATGLTSRELAVLQLLAQGLTADGIAHRLGTSPRTVHKHLEHLYRKLGVRDRLMAVQRARAEGLLPARTTEAVDGHDVRVGPAARVAGERYAVVRMGPDRARPHCG